MCVHFYVHTFVFSEEISYFCKKLILSIMATLTIRDFRSNLSATLSKASAGERIFVRRHNQVFAIVPVDDEISISPALMREIKKARKEHQNGETLKFDTAADAQKWMDEL